MVRKFNIRVNIDTSKKAAKQGSAVYDRKGGYDIYINRDPRGRAGIAAQRKVIAAEKEAWNIAKALAKSIEKDSKRALKTYQKGLEDRIKYKPKYISKKEL